MTPTKEQVEAVANYLARQYYGYQIASATPAIKRIICNDARAAISAYLRAGRGRANKGVENEEEINEA